MTGVVEIPVVNGQAVLCSETTIERRAGVRREDVERRRFDPVLDRPFDRALEHRAIVAVHPEDEAAVDHHAEVVKAANRGGVVAPQVLILPLLGQVGGVECLEPDEQTPQAGLDRLLEKIRAPARR